MNYQVFTTSKIQDRILNNKQDERQYRVLDCIGKGECAKIYQVVDQESSNDQLVAKISSNEAELRNEIKTMTRIQNKLKDNTSIIPKVLSYGAYRLKYVDEDTGKKVDKMEFYYIMPYMGSCTLEDVLAKFQGKLSTQSILRLAIKIIEVIRFVHKAGYVYNDLKPDNIMIKNFDESQTFDMFENAELSLIDFGFCSKYIETVQRKDGSKKFVHIDEKDTEDFKSNMFFASLNTLNFKSQSRRDDLIMLSYILMSISNGGEIKGVNQQSVDHNMRKYQLDETSAVLHTLKDCKGALSDKDLCIATCKHYSSFIRSIFSCKFDEKP